MTGAPRALSPHSPVDALRATISRSAPTEPPSMHISAIAAALAATLAGTSGCADPEPLHPSASPTAALAAAGDTVAVWMTTGNKSALLAKQPTLTFAAGTSNNATITVD